MSVSQTAFHTALLDPEKPTPIGLSDGEGHPAGRRFSVYRNNVAASLTEALELSFPAIQKLIGAENFRNLAGLFLRSHPPETPMLSQYGSEMPAFLAAFEPLRSVPYLADVAMLEQAIRVSYHAKDAAPADPSVLAGLSPDQLAQTRFVLAPSINLVRSQWPIHAIWAFNLENGPKPEAGAQNVLLMRPEFDPQLHPISDGTAEFVDALQNGGSLGDANESALAVEEGFDLSQALSLLLGGGAITEIRLET